MSGNNRNIIFRKMKTAKSLLITVITMVIAVSFIAGIYCNSSYVYADEKADTSITGYPDRINKDYNAKVKISATVSPAEPGRSVMLQRYNSDKDKWSTILETTIEDEADNDISFFIPKKYRKKTTSIWRIYIPATSTAKRAKSSRITITTSTIKNLEITAGSACIYRIDSGDEDSYDDGEYIYNKSMNKKCAHASTTKIMSAVLLMESGLIDTDTKISKHAAGTPWGSHMLAKGDVFKTRDLLYAMLLPSSNDAATAVAEKVGGSESKFVDKMNKKAKDMGFTKTHFANPHGLDAKGHYSTAAELAKLTAYAYSFPEIRKCFATKTRTITSINNKKRLTLHSSNAIFKYVKEFRGGKTGTTDNARCCFAGIYKYHGSTYVTVVLGCGYGNSRWNDTKKLHEYIRNYAD